LNVTYLTNVEGVETSIVSVTSRTGLLTVCVIVVLSTPEITIAAIDRFDRVT